MVVTFSAGNFLGDAANRGHYAISRTGKGKAKVQRIRLAGYDATARIVTLRLARPIQGNPKLRLAITGLLPAGPYSAQI